MKHERSNPRPRRTRETGEYGWDRNSSPNYQKTDNIPVYPPTLFTWNLTPALDHSPFKGIKSERQVPAVDWWKANPLEFGASGINLFATSDPGRKGETT